MAEVHSAFASQQGYTFESSDGCDDEKLILSSL